MRKIEQMLPFNRPSPIKHKVLNSAPTQPLVVTGLGFPNDALRRVDLTVSAGECVALTGLSGIGKSRLLRLIADLDLGSGTARIGNLTREAMPANQWRRMVVYVPADSGWWSSPVAIHMSDPERARSLLAAFGLPEKLMEASPDDISSGERQRLALIRALILRPRFLLLDEPTSGLDRASALKVEAALARAREAGIGILIVSHDPDQVARVADRHNELSETGLVEVPLWRRSN